MVAVKITDTFFLKNRGVIVTCAPDMPVTMTEIRRGLLRVVRHRDGAAWIVVGVERRCVPVQPNQDVGLLIRGECDLRAGDEVEIVRGTP